LTSGIMENTSTVPSCPTPEILLGMVFVQSEGTYELCYERST
jgi:hypothetical protein